MKITFFDFATLNYGGGAEKNFMKFGNWLSNKGYEVSFVTGSYKLNRLSSKILKTQNYEKNIYDVDLKDKFGVKEYLKFDLKDLFLPTKNRKEIKELIKDSEVIISKNEIFDIIPLKFLFFTPPRKIVFGFHTPIFYPIARDFKSKIHNLIYNSLVYSLLISGTKTRLLVLTDSEKKLMKNKFDNKIAVIPNPLDIKKFYQKNYIKNKKFKIYYIGRMTKQKGIDTLYNTILCLSKCKEFKNMEFYFAGSGEHEDYLKDLSKKFKNCHFLGFQIDVIRLYHDADIVVVPSRWESYCYTVAEAASCGVPVIASNISGPNNLIINNKTGFLIEPDNSIILEESTLHLYKLWNNTFDKFVSMGKMARKHIIKNFEENMINNKIEKFILKKDNNS